MLNIKCIAFLRNVRRKKLPMEFFVIFSLLVIIPVLLSANIIASYSNSIIENEVEQYNSTVLKNMVNYVDERILKIKQQSTVALTDYRLNDLFYTGGDDDIDYVQCSEVILKLAGLKESEPMIEDIAIYFNNLDIVISSDGLYQFEYYFNNIYPLENYDIKDWSNLFNNMNNFTILNTQRVKNSGRLPNTKDNRQLITMCTSIPYYYSVPKASLVVFINERKINEIISSYSSIEQNNYVVISEEGRINTQCSDSGIVRENDVRLLANQIKNTSKGSLRYKMGDERVFITYQLSKQMGWIYLTIVPFSHFLKSSKYIQQVMYFVCIGFVFVGIFISLWLTKRMYKPISTLIGFLNKVNRKVESEENAASKDSRRVFNEFNFISNQFEKIYNANETLRKSLNTSLPFLQENLLFRIVKGNFSSEEEMLCELKKYNVRFEGNCFAVLSIKVDLLDNIHDNEYTKEPISDIYSKIKSIISALLSQKYEYCYNLNTDIYNISYIINSREQESGMDDICKMIIDFFSSDDYRVRLTIGIGGTVYSVKDIQESYCQSIKALNHRSVGKQSEILIYEQSTMGKKNDKYLEETDRVKAITNFFINGDYEKTMNTALQILNQHMENSSTCEAVNRITFLLIQAAENALKSKNHSIDEIGPDAADRYRKIDRFIYKDEYRKHIKDIYEAIINVMRMKSKSEEIVDFAIQYIKDNFSKDIYLGLIAEELDISANYLSHLFKEYTGIGFSEYLVKVRIEKAKEILAETNQNIQEVCLAVGYLNSNSFIRAFKKIEGITPGRYKEVAQKNVLQKLY